MAASDEAKLQASAAQVDEDYDSASDEDFNPDTALAEDVSSSSEDEAAIDTTTTTTAATKSKRKRTAPAPEDLDSGDEATIQARNKAKKRKGQKAAAADEDITVFSDDEGGEGGLIKTRAQRRTEQRDHRRYANAVGATIDVDSVWARLASAPIGRDEGAATAHGEQVASATVRRKEGGDEYITIKRTYKFAGETQTEEKRVLRSSKEAQLYLAEKEGDKGEENEKTEADKENADAVGESEDANDAQSSSSSSSVRRPLRRPSRFDPNPSGWVKALAPEHQLTWPRKGAATTALNTAPGQIPQRVKTSDLKAKNVNTVDKSRLDWAGYVDKEGIATELDEYGKSKEGYLARTDFLNRVDARQEDTRREARIANAPKPKPVAVGD